MDKATNSESSKWTDDLGGLSALLVVSPVRVLASRFTAAFGAVEDALGMPQRCAVLDLGDGVVGVAPDEGVGYYDVLEGLVVRFESAD